MENKIERLEKLLTYTEMKFVVELSKLINADKANLINIKSDITNCSQTSAKYVCRLLYASGILHTQSVGCKGSIIKVIDKENYDKLVASCCKFMV